jgi:hypothetical protein
MSQNASLGSDLAARQPVRQGRRTSLENSFTSLRSAVSHPSTVGGSEDRRVHWLSFNFLQASRATNMVYPLLVFPFARFAILVLGLDLYFRRYDYLPVVARRVDNGRCCGTLVSALLITRRFSSTSRAAAPLIAHDQREGWRSRSGREHAQSETNRCLARMAGRRPSHHGFRTCFIPRQDCQTPQLGLRCCARRNRAP